MAGSLTSEVETPEFGRLFVAACECGARCAHTSAGRRDSWLGTHVCAMTGRWRRPLLMEIAAQMARQQGQAAARS